MELHKLGRKLPKWVVYIIFGFFCLSILFILRALRPPTLHTTYSLIFPDRYQNAQTVEIAGFGESERWEGMHTLDSERSIDGETGMNIFSMNGAPTRITLRKNLNLKAYDKLLAYIYISDKATLQNIASLSVGLTDNKGSEATYNTGGLKTGWNYVQLPLANFKPGIDMAGISAVAVELISKKGQTASATLDRIWVQPPLNTGDFARVDTSYTNLETVNKKTFLHLSSSGPVNTFFTKTTVASRFSYTVGLSPLKFGVFGLSFLTDPQTGDGYYFVVSGKQMTRWYLLKKTGGHETELQSGSLQQGAFETGTMLWLRAERNADELSVSYTVNGLQYLPITQIKDSTFDKGSFGLLSTGSYLIESVDVKE